MNDPYFTDITQITTNSGYKLNIYSTGKGDLLILCLHGCGLSARSFGPLANDLSDIAHVIAFDLPCHGHSDKSSLSLNNLINCTVEVAKLYGNNKRILLIGHSFGAALAIKAASHIDNLIAVFLIEFYQLKNIDKLTSTIPSEFTFDGLLKYIKSERGVTIEFAKYCIETQAHQIGDRWQWICNPNDTRSYWSEWYENATQTFLSLTHTEDTELMVAHMQGKLQLEIIPNSNHFLHENKSNMVSKIVKNLLKRMQNIKVFETRNVA